MQIDLSYKCIREDTLLNALLEKQSKMKPELISEEFKFTSIVTKYGTNQHTYQIESIDFERSPLSTFKLKDGREVSFKDYTKEKYGVTIKEDNQPLAIVKSQRTGQEIALIPELCFMTGLTDNMRANFNLMKSINQVLQRGAADRLKDIVQFVNDLTAQPKVQELIKPWGVQLKPDPLKVQGQLIPAGQVLMGGNIKFDCQINGR